MNANYTKKMIMENLINLLNRMPLNKITVGKLAEECGINRNTIYYHFRDLNEIIDTIFEIRLKRVLNESDNISWEDNFIEEFQFAVENKLRFSTFTILFPEKLCLIICTINRDRL